MELTGMAKWALLLGTPAVFFAVISELLFMLYRKTQPKKSLFLIGGIAVFDTLFAIFTLGLAAAAIVYRAWWLTGVLSITTLSYVRSAFLMLRRMVQKEKGNA